MDTLIRCLVTRALRCRGGLDSLPAHALAALLEDERDILGALAGGDRRAAEEAFGARQTRSAELIADALASHPQGPMTQ